jgi:flagellar basal body-associated protein FliL
MTELNETAAIGSKQPRRGLFRSWKIIVPLFVAIAALAGGAGYWYWTARQPASHANESHLAAPPTYLDLKPFVVSLVDGAGSSYFVQLGVTLKLSGAEAGNAITSISPELEDTMRQTVLAFKAEDVGTPAGVEKLRHALIAAANNLLLRQYGAAEIKRLTADSPSDAVVQNVLFTTLVVE